MLRYELATSLTLNIEKYCYSCVNGLADLWCLRALADPGGAHPARAPPNGRGPMIFYAPNAIFSHFFLARSARD